MGFSRDGFSSQLFPHRDWRGNRCDGLETLEEIDQEGREAFLNAGGKEFHYIPCLNDSDAWISALCDVTVQHLSGWPTLAAPDALALAESQAAAIALGADR